MKPTSFAWALLFATASALAADPTPPDLPPAEAEVRRVDTAANKISLKHGEIKNLDMPPMSMVFQVSDPALLGKVQHLSNAISVVLLLAYGLFLYYSLVTHKALFAGSHEADSGEAMALWPLGKAIGVLALATGLIAWVSEILVGAIEPSAKAFGLSARASVNGQDVRLLVPTTYMNRSGQSIGAVAGFYKITPAEILVAHDELDLPPGQIRLKTGGGHGGHNGLRDTISALGNQNGFHRLRIGIGHPGSSALVTGFVLGKAPRSEQDLIDQAVDEALRHTDALLAGELARVMNQLTGFKAGQA